LLLRNVCLNDPGSHSAADRTSGVISWYVSCLYYGLDDSGILVEFPAMADILFTIASSPSMECPSILSNGYQRANLSSHEAKHVHASSAEG